MEEGVEDAFGAQVAERLGFVLGAEIGLVVGEGGEAVPDRGGRSDLIGFGNTAERERYGGELHGANPSLQSFDRVRIQPAPDCGPGPHRPPTGLVTASGVLIENA